MGKLLAMLCLFFLGIPQLYGADSANSEEKPVNDLRLPTLSLLQKTETFQFKNLPDPFVLEGWPIIHDSEQVTVDSDPLAKDLDYQIDYPTGTITLLKDYPPEAIVQVTYQTLPFAIKKQYKRHLFQRTQPLVETPESESGPDYTRQQPMETTPPPLQVTGTQTFGVSVGSGRALAQNQALRISVDGKVSENVNVTALLSDQDLPIQPEGTTEDIQDIDQKLIRITSPNVTGTLGDFEGSLGGSELIFFPRALEGVQVEGNFKWGTFHLIPTAVPKGQSASKTIRSEEGRSQYRIDVDGEFVIVKAGSEIVWLNGEQMRRGENNDYVIRDYGDPIIEFTSRHLITSNDIIRVDFEFIPEDLAYQRNLQGLNVALNLPGGHATIGLGYAVESDLNDPENAFIVLSEQDVADLRRNELDADGDGKPLIAPQRHTVWGINGRLDLAEGGGILRYAPTLEGQLALSALDENTFSRRDAKVLSRAWKLLASSLTEKLQWNLEMLSLDANFVPVGASSASRTRFQYEERYAQEQFDDLYLLDTTGSEQPPDERSIDLDLLVKPFDWLTLNYGLGRTEDRFNKAANPPIDNALAETTNDNATLQNNFNWGIDLNPQGGSMLPRFRNDFRRNTSTVDGQEQFRKERRYWLLSDHIRPFNLNGSIEQLDSTDLNLDDGINLNRKRNISTGRMDLVDFQWASVSTSYAVEKSFDKEALLTVDGKTLGFSDWQPATSAKTWTIGLFSQPQKWATVSTNLSRRVFKVQRGLGSDSTTQLADVDMRLTPFNRALDGQITYELDKKLATERREIYTNINPFTGREIQPGEGHYVKIDDLHYQEDYEEGNYIKFIQNVEDKPVSAIDVKFQVRFEPRRIALRHRSPRWGQEGDITGKWESESPNRLAWLANALRGQMLVNITEEQEDPDPSSLYLLRDLQNQRTVFGRINQRYQLDFSPSPLLNLDLGVNINRILNRRINNRERRQRSRDWDAGLTLNPASKVSLGFKWEQRREREKFAELRQPESSEASNIGEAQVSVPISDLTQFERTNTLDFRYELSRVLRLEFAGSYELTADLERLDDEPEARTRTLSLENRLTYSFIGKGRIDFSYRLGYGNSEGGVPFTRYNFYDGFSHEIRLTGDYRVRTFTDLVLRLNYRLLSTEQQKPEHRMEMEVVAEL